MYTKKACEEAFFGNVGSVELRGITNGHRARGVYRVSRDCGSDNPRNSNHGRLPLHRRGPLFPHSEVLLVLQSVDSLGTPLERSRSRSRSRPPTRVR